MSTNLTLKDYFKKNGKHSYSGFLVTNLTQDGKVTSEVRSQDQWTRSVHAPSTIEPVYYQDNILLKAIVKGDMQEVDLLLSMGHDPLWHDKDGKNALNYAIDAQNVPLLKQLGLNVPLHNFADNFKLELDQMKPEFAAWLKDLIDQKVFVVQAEEKEKLMTIFKKVIPQKPQTLPSTIKEFYLKFHKKNPDFANVIVGFQLKGDRRPNDRGEDHLLSDQKDWDQWVNQSLVDVAPRQILPVLCLLKVANESSLLSFIEDEQWSEVNRLLDMGFDPEVVWEAEGTNALHWAIFKRNLPLMKRLTQEFKMDLSKPDKRGYPSFRYNEDPQKHYDNEICQWLIGLENADVIQKANENTALGDQMLSMTKKMKDQKEAALIKAKEEKEAKEAKELKLKYTFDVFNLLERMKPIDVLAHMTKGVLEAKAMKEKKDVKEKEDKDAKEAKEAKEAKDAKEAKEAKDAEEKELKKDSDQIKEKELQEKEIKEKEIKEKEIKEKEIKEKEIKEKEIKEKELQEKEIKEKELKEKEIKEKEAKEKELQEAKEKEIKEKEIKEKELKEKEIKEKEIKEKEAKEKDPFQSVKKQLNALMMMEGFQPPLHMQWYQLMISIIDSPTEDLSTKKVKLAASIKATAHLYPLLHAKIVDYAF